MFLATLLTGVRLEMTSKMFKSFFSKWKQYFLKRTIEKREMRNLILNVNTRFNCD